MSSEKWNVLVISEDNELRLEQLDRSDWYDGEPDIVGADGFRLTLLIGLLREVSSYADR